MAHKPAMRAPSLRRFFALVNWAECLLRPLVSKTAQSLGTRAGNGPLQTAKPLALAIA